MENEMMNNMDAMTENLTDAMPEVDNLVPSVDENHAEMSSASGSFGKTAVFMLAGAAAYKGAELLCKHVLVPLCYDEPCKAVGGGLLQRPCGRDRR